MAGPAGHPGGGRRWLSLAALCTAAGLVWLAFADLGVAVPTIANDLGGELSALSWANNAFALVTGALVIAAGRFGDLFGRRRMLELGIVLFGVFSIVSAVAPSIAVLIAGRGLMGIGAALILPATLALIPPQFDGRDQALAFSAWGAVAWVGQAAGPALGGVVTDVLGWPWLFWLNLPLAALTLVALRLTTPESTDPAAARKIDIVGIVTIGVGAFALLFALTEGPDTGFGDPLVLGLFAASAILAAAWVWIEHRVSAPLVDLRIFLRRAFDGALIANLTMNLAFAGISFLLVLYLQQVRGHSAMEAGLLLLPSTVSILIFNSVGASMILRTGARLPVLLGLLGMGAGSFLLGFISSDSSYWVLAAGLLVLGAGVGLLSTPVADVSVGGAPPELAGEAAGVFKMSSMLGGAIGVALLVAFERGLSDAEVASKAHAAGLSDADVAKLQAALVDTEAANQVLASVPPDQRASLVAAGRDVLADGTAGAFWITAGLAVLATVVVLFVWPRRDFR